MFKPSLSEASRPESMPMPPIVPPPASDSAAGSYLLVEP